MFVNFNILNQLGSPAINSNVFANRPAAGQTGRLFVSTDTFEIYRDNGTTWDLIGGPGSSTITGTGTATQVAYFTSSQAIGSSANLYWDNTAGALGINTATPGAELDVHGTGIMVQLNSTTATANSLLAFQRSGSGLWRIGDVYNGGNNYFELHNTVLTNNAIEVLAASNEATFLSGKTYSTGNAIGIRVQHNLIIPNAVNVGVAALGGVNSNLNLTLQGSTTVAATGRQGLEGSTSINFTGAGTLTMTQGSTVRAFSALSSVYAFNGSAVGTITHLAGLRICFPDNPGSAVNITNNYALLINNQTTGTGTVTYTNRWGIYQEGASDLNYLNANLLLGSTTNNGNKLQVTGNGNLTGDMTADAYYLNGMTAGNGALYWASDRVTLANYNTNGVLHFEVNGGAFAALFNALGNLGIGTSSPAARLTVEGASTVIGQTNVSARFSDNFNSTLLISHPASTSATATITGNEQLGFATGSVGSIAERMRITSGGNVLIGTTTDAGQKLQVNGSGFFGNSVEVNLNQNALTRVALVNNSTATGAYVETTLQVGASGAGGAFGKFGPTTTTYKTITGNTTYVYNNSIGGDIALLNDNGSGKITMAVVSGIAQWTLTSGGNIEQTGSIKTGAPTTGTAAAWKLGSRVAATVVVNTTEYIEVDIGGTLYKLATVT